MAHFLIRPTFLAIIHFKALSSDVPAVWQLYAMSYLTNRSNFCTNIRWRAIYQNFLYSLWHGFRIQNVTTTWLEERNQASPSSTWYVIQRSSQLGLKQYDARLIHTLVFNMKFLFTFMGIVYWRKVLEWYNLRCCYQLCLVIVFRTSNAFHWIRNRSLIDCMEWNPEDHDVKWLMILLSISKGQY